MDSLTLTEGSGNISCYLRFKPIVSERKEVFIKALVQTDGLSIQDSGRVIAWSFGKTRILVAYTSKVSSSLQAANKNTDAFVREKIQKLNSRLSIIAKLESNNISPLNTEYELAETPILVNYVERAPLPHLYIDIDNLIQPVPELSALHQKLNQDNTLAGCVLLVNTIGKPYHVMTALQTQGVIPRFIIVEHGYIDAAIGVISQAVQNLLSGGNLVVLKYNNASTTVNNGNTQQLQNTASDVVPLPAPKEMMLEQNFPNPVESATTIRFAVTEASHTRLCIYNGMGQEITCLVDKPLEAGQYQIEWKVTNQTPAGVYWYRLISGKHTITKSLTILK